MAQQQRNGAASIVPRAAVYCRVSSDEQRENQTIQSQIEVAKRWMEFQRLADKPIDVYDYYLDDGISGTIALADRPAGKRLLDDADEGKFSLVLVYKIDRLGRDPRDILNTAYQLDQLGVPVKSLTEEFDMTTSAGKYMFNIFAASAGFHRDTQIERSIEGTNHWAKQGLWLGGIVPYGYYVLGQKKAARLVVSEIPLPGFELSEAGVVRMVYRLLAEEGWSCIRIAEHLNALGIPPSYTKDNRKIARNGKRKERTSGIWRPGRIRNLVVNTVYKGTHEYGRRSKKQRERIPRSVPAIVDSDTWERAQQALKRNQLLAVRNAKRRYLLRGLITCGICELNYSGTGQVRPNGKLDTYYVCNGKQPFRGRILGKCPGKAVSGLPLEEAIWNDILVFLHDPGPVLSQLAEQMNSRQEQAHDLEKERMTQAIALNRKEQERERILDLYRRGRITIADLERQLEKIAAEEAEIKAHLTSLDTTLKGQETIATRLVEAQDMLQTLRQRLKEEFTWEEKREIVEALVLNVQVNTTGEGREKTAQILVTYAFDGGPRNGRVVTRMDTGSLPRRA